MKLTKVFSVYTITLALAALNLIVIYNLRTKSLSIFKALLRYNSDSNLIRLQQSTQISLFLAIYNFFFKWAFGNISHEEQSTMVTAGVSIALDILLILYTRYETVEFTMFLQTIHCLLSAMSVYLVEKKVKDFLKSTNAASSCSIFYTVKKGLFITVLFSSCSLYFLKSFEIAFETFSPELFFLITEFITLIKCLFIVLKIVVERVFRKTSSLELEDAPLSLQEEVDEFHARALKKRILFFLAVLENCLYLVIEGSVSLFSFRKFAGHFFLYRRTIELLGKIATEVQEYMAWERIRKDFEKSFDEIDLKGLEEEALKECFVCMEPMEKGRLTPCGHLLHEHCLYRWLEKNQTCPYCRDNIPEALKNGKKRIPKFLWKEKTKGVDFERMCGALCVWNELSYYTQKVEKEILKIKRGLGMLEDLHLKLIKIQEKAWEKNRTDSGDKTNRS